MVGVTVGKNFAIGNGIVVGVAGDAALSTMNGKYRATTPPGSTYNNTTQGVNATGSLRGTIGYDAGAFMPYLTAGLALASETRVSGFSGKIATAGSVGYTVGVGVKVIVTGNASLDVQYRYSNYGAATYMWQNNIPKRDNPVVGTTTQTVTVGMNWGF